MFGATKTRLTAAAMLATTALLALAPAAHADRGRHNGWVRYKGVPEARVQHGAWGPPGRVYVRHESNAGPLIAGLVGGFVLGTVLNNANQHCAAPAEYRYYDPYGDDWYGSVDSYWASNRWCRHPRVLRVIEVRSGDCVRVIRWSDGGWRECDRNDGRVYDRDGRYDDRRYDDRGDNGRYDDQRYDDNGRGYDRGEDRDR